MITELEKATKFKLRLRAGEICLGAQIALSDPAIAEILGRAGYDWLVVDTEHSSNSAMTVRAMLQGAANTGAVLLARPLRLEPDEIRRFLDLGSPGVLCPFINTGDDALRLVQSCRYPPAGTRGYGPRRAGMYGFDADEYFHKANEAMICIAIIETRSGIENIEDIVRVDGIDGICIGPMDLSISLGIFKQFEHPAYLSDYEKVRQACKKFKKAMGTACYSLDHAKRCVAQRDPLLLVGGDDHYLALEGRRWVESLRSVKEAN
jgi:4-hydroxy-2-oxoheptanedioate aldolase